MRICLSILALLAAAGPALRAQSPLYSEDFNGVVGSLPAGWAAFSENAGVLASRNDGASEYEHRLIADNTTDLRALAYYADTQVTDPGAWRDTTVQALLRYSGGANNQNGLIARARNATATGAGDFYHARLNGDSIQIFRFNGASATLLSSIATPSLATITDRLFRLTTENIRTAGTDQVRLSVELYNGATVASGVMQSLQVTDASASAITRSGGVGVRSFHPIAANSGQRATFDDFRVTGNRPNLLWYDDYQDNTAIRSQTFSAGGAGASVVNQRQEFFLGNGATAVALLDFDSETSQSRWADAQASATLRLNTNLAGAGQIAGALLLRENGVAAASGSGDYYAYRLVRDENGGAHRAELLRSNGGVETLLSQTALLDADIAESANLFVQFQAFNVPGGVWLYGLLSSDINYAAPAGLIDFTDTDASRLTGPGAAGFRADGGLALVAGALNFDNFMVVQAVPEPATWILFAAGALALRRRTQP